MCIVESEGNDPDTRQTFIPKQLQRWGHCSEPSVCLVQCLPFVELIATTLDNNVRDSHLERKESFVL